jgi:hypothetical protein
MSLTLIELPGRFAVCRLEPDTSIPEWAFRDVFSITRTDEELSIVCHEEFVAAGTVCEGGWSGLKVQGPLDFGLTGVMASLVGPLAEAGISIFAISTYNTDYLLVKSARLQEAIEVLARAGHKMG